MSDFGSEEENAAVDALAAEFQHLGTADIPIKPPILAIPLTQVYDDFYHNPLDWSVHNIVAYIDEADVFMVEPSDAPQTWKISDQGNAVSVKFSPDGRNLAVGTYNGTLQVLDVETRQLIWDNKAHGSRIACLAWHNELIFTGSRDHSINANDPVNDVSIQIGSHLQEVCGMKVSPAGNKLVTGGNDNVVKVWDLTKLYSESPVAQIDEVFSLHKSAIKAIDFSSTNSDIVATGGGCNDGIVFVWNVNTQEIYKQIEIDKQITNLSWLESGKEIVTTYGFGWNRNTKFNIEHNSIDIWSLETSKVVQRFEGHKGRVLFSAMAPNKEGFVTAASDNFLKFWKPDPNEWVLN
jgi:WD40 repeat protein